MPRPHDYAVTTFKHEFHYEFLRSINVHATLIRSCFHQLQKGDHAIAMPDVTDVLPLNRIIQIYNYVCKELAQLYWSGLC